MVPPVDGFPGEGRVLGSVHHWVSNLSFGSGAQAPLRSTGSPVHVSASFEARAPGPVSSQLSSNDGLEEPFKVVLVSCQLSPAGIRFLDILFPPENSALLTVGLPGSTRTLTGFPRSARTRFARGGCPLYPGTVVLSRPVDILQPAPAAFSSGQSYTPLNHPI